jgi:hypothetical protein
VRRLRPRPRTRVDRRRGGTLASGRGDPLVTRRPTPRWRRCWRCPRCCGGCCRAGHARQRVLRGHPVGRVGRRLPGLPAGAGADPGATPGLGCAVPGPGRRPPVAAAWIAAAVRARHPPAPADRPRARNGWRAVVATVAILGVLGACGLSWANCSRWATRLDTEFKVVPRSTSTALPAGWTEISATEEGGSGGVYLLIVVVEGHDVAALRQRCGATGGPLSAAGSTGCSTGARTAWRSSRPRPGPSSGSTSVRAGHRPRTAGPRSP